MDTTIVDLPCVINEFGQTDAISVMADLICIIMHMQIAWSSRQWSNQNHWPWKPRCRHHNLSFILYNNRVMTQKWNFGNAVIICILLNFPKGASLASSGFLINTFHRYKNCKKTLWGLQNHVHPLYCWTITNLESAIPQRWVIRNLYLGLYHHKNLMSSSDW